MSNSILDKVNKFQHETKRIVLRVLHKTQFKSDHKKKGWKKKRKAQKNKEFMTVSR